MDLKVLEAGPPCRWGVGGGLSKLLAGGLSKLLAGWLSVPTAELSAHEVPSKLNPPRYSIAGSADCDVLETAADVLAGVDTEWLLM